MNLGLLHLVLFAGSLAIGLINRFNFHLGYNFVSMYLQGSIYEYFGATGYQVAVVLSAGIIMSVFVYWKCSRS